MRQTMDQPTLSTPESRSIQGTSRRTQRIERSEAKQTTNAGLEPGKSSHLACVRRDLYSIVRFGYSSLKFMPRATPCTANSPVAVFCTLTSSFFDASASMVIVPESGVSSNASEPGSLASARNLGHGSSCGKRGRRPSGNVGTMLLTGTMVSGAGKPTVSRVANCAPVSISSRFDMGIYRGFIPPSSQRTPWPLAPKLHKKVALITLVLCTTCTIPNCQPISVLLKVSFLTSGPFLDLSVPLSHKDHSWDPQYVNCGQRGTPRLSSFTWVTLLSAWSTCPVLENCLTKRHHPPPRHWLVHDATKVPVGLAVRLT
mmetsp:Transcript_46842/g.124425  ORF Transcript_46842/g.124425 Transcript_46842/m.124425 type:complete len:314 (+) Transcript_46842:666-1607(+)